MNRLEQQSVTESPGRVRKWSVGQVEAWAVGQSGELAVGRLGKRTQEQADGRTGTPAGTDGYVAVIDFGTTGLKVLLVDSAGQVGWRKKSPVRFTNPQGSPPQHVEFSPSDVWAAVCRLLREGAAAVGAKRIVAVTATSFRSGYVMLDRRGRELHAGPNLDRRPLADPPVDPELWSDRLYRSSGHFLDDRRLPYRLWWLQRHQPAAYEAIATVLHVHDWLLYRLGGQAVADRTVAPMTTLFDLSRSCWHEEHIAALGLPSSWFPPVVGAATCVGEVSVGVAEAAGLRPKTPVITSGADTQCGLIGVGAVTAGQMAAVAGSTLPIQLILGQPFIDGDGRFWSSWFVQPDMWILEANAGVAGLALRWLRDFWGIDESDLVAVLHEIPPGSHGVCSLLGPTLMHARQQIGRPGMLGGITVWGEQPTTPKVVVRALLENIAFAVRGNMEQLEQAVGIAPQPVRIGGGVARTPGLCQLIADVCEREVWVPVEPDATAVGAAACAFTGLGRFPDLATASEAMVEWTEPMTSSAPTGLYEPFFQRWKQWHMNYRAL